ncbi:MAG TPA: helix-turn-helix domain-containing protein [Balneolaceae bacterium]|nr:helix-turn-helix domain-containing protein [Balneolaceae bacterium]
MSNYQRIANAIKYINDHSTEQPGLEDVADAVHLSPYHFHRLFKEWGGVTPKEFLQYISLSQAKKLLDDNQTLEETAFQTGLSSTSRLHDLFVNIEGMTPGEFKNGGKALPIRYCFSDGLFGDMLIASTGKGVCNLLFVDDKDRALAELKRAWPEADIAEGQDTHIDHVKKLFNTDWNHPDKIKLHIRGTDFQLKVWEALLKIPPCKPVSYSDVADAINNPKLRAPSVRHWPEIRSPF